MYPVKSGTMTSVSVSASRSSNRSRHGLHQPSDHSRSILASERALDGQQMSHPCHSRRDTRLVHTSSPNSIQVVGTNTSISTSHTNNAAQTNIQVEHEDKQDLQQRNVYIYGLPDYFRSSTFRVMCEVYGRIESCKLAMSGDTVTVCKGYGFVLYAHVKSALACIAALQGKFIGSKQLQARRADLSAVPQPISRFAYPASGAEESPSAHANGPASAAAAASTTTTTTTTSTTKPTSAHTVMNAPYLISAPPPTMGTTHTTSNANTMAFIPICVEESPPHCPPTQHHRSGAALSTSSSGSGSSHPLSMLFNAVEPMTHCFSTSVAAAAAASPYALCQQTTSSYSNNSWTTTTTSCEDNARLSYGNSTTATPLMMSPSTPTCLLNSNAMSTAHSSHHPSARPSSQASMRRSGQLGLSESRCQSEGTNEGSPMSMYSSGGCGGGDQSSMSAPMSAMDPSVTSETVTPPCMNYIVGPYDRECNVLPINWSPLFL